MSSALMADGSREDTADHAGVFVKRKSEEAAALSHPAAERRQCNTHINLKGKKTTNRQIGNQL